MGKRGPSKGCYEAPLRTDLARQEAFLTALAETGSIIESARRASPHSESPCLSTFKSYMRDSAEFAAKVQESLDTFRDSLIRAAVTRGRDGYKRPIFQKGEKVGEETIYSDNLLLAELRKHFPEYREKIDHNHKITIAPAGAWVISSEDVSFLTQDERRTLAGLMDKVRDGRGEAKRLEHKPSEVVDAEFSEVSEAEALW